MSKVGLGAWQFGALNHIAGGTCKLSFSMCSCSSADYNSKATSRQMLASQCSTSAPGVEVDGEVMPADAVVVAMGPWSGQAAKWGLPIPAVRSRSPFPGLEEPLELAAKLAAASCCHVFLALQ